MQAKSKEDPEEGEITTEDAKAKKLQELKAAAAELKVPPVFSLFLCQGSAVAYTYLRVPGGQEKDGGGGDIIWAVK